MRQPTTTTTGTFRFEDLSASIDRYSENYAQDVTRQHYFGFPTQAILDAENRLLSPKVKSVAYFSMEYGIASSIYNSFQLKRPLDEKNQYFSHEVFSNYWLCDYLFKIQIDKMLDIPIASGGLGVLAGDTMKSVADQGFSVVGLGVLWNKGYFKQKFWYKHGQVPDEQTWDPYTYPGLIPLKNIITIDTKEGPLHLRLWKYYVYSFDHNRACPLVLLDSNIEQNNPKLRKLTDQLYRSDVVWWKLFQRLILGLGGMKALGSLGYEVDCYHLNEGHAAFAILEKYLSLEDKNQLEEFKKKFMFTCHTPVAAGHDRFSLQDVAGILNDQYVGAANIFGKENPQGDQINLTYMALTNCSRVNAVAQKHGEVMRVQFPQFADKIKSITNGIHHHTWISSSFQELFDRYGETFGDWRSSPENLAQVRKLEKNDQFRRDLFLAHQVNKRNLMEITQRWRLKEGIFTLCWARRIAGYKRPVLILQNIQRLIEMAYTIGPIQIILAGKAHPNDNIGAAHVDEILDRIDQLNAHHKLINVLMLENYDTYFGKLLTNSVDVWLNNPLPPFEASGTSGMKAILNGVLQMTTLDGWVVEVAQDDIGWIFGYQHHGPDLGSEGNLRLDEDSHALCEKLAEALKLYYATYSKGKINTASVWIDKMIHCIEKSAFFNTHRMVLEYNQTMWSL